MAAARLRPLGAPREPLQARQVLPVRQVRLVLARLVHAGTVLVVAQLLGGLAVLAGDGGHQAAVAELVAAVDADDAGRPVLGCSATSQLVNHDALEAAQVDPRAERLVDVAAGLLASLPSGLLHEEVSPELGHGGLGVRLHELVADHEQAAPPRRCAEVHGVGLEPLRGELGLAHHVQDLLEVGGSIGAEAAHVLDADHLGVQREHGEHGELGQLQPLVVGLAVRVRVAADLAGDADEHGVHLVLVAGYLEAVLLEHQVLLEHDGVGELELEYLDRVRAHVDQQDDLVTGRQRS